MADTPADERSNIIAADAPRCTGSTSDAPAPDDGLRATPVRAPIPGKSTVPVRSAWQRVQRHPGCASGPTSRPGRGEVIAYRVDRRNVLVRRAPSSKTTNILRFPRLAVLHSRVKVAVIRAPRCISCHARGARPGPGRHARTAAASGRLATVSSNSIDFFRANSSRSTMSVVFIARFSLSC